jgi:DNA-binding NtrC family response regulator
MKMTIATILLVDDEVPFVETMTKRLTKREITVLTAFSGQQALSVLAEKDGVEVVILDVKMPGLDGIETLKRIRADFPLVEVIMLTGHATVESAIDGMKLGAFDYLMKPCDLDHLIEKVLEAAQRRRKHEEKIVQARIKEITARRA